METTPQRFFYVLAQPGMMILPAYWLGWNSFTVPGAVFTVVFGTGTR
jgi:hypothetical protein